MNITCIGHITRDKIVTPTQTVYMAGGTTTYVARGIKSFLSPETPGSEHPTDFTLIAALAPNDHSIVEQMRQDGLNVLTIDSTETTFFENIYGLDSSDRKQRVRSTGDPFSIEKLFSLLEPMRKLPERPYIILGSLLAEDFPLDVVKYCRQIGHVVMDAQGYFRHVCFEQDIEGNRIGRVDECDWTDKSEFLANIDILKLNENEAYRITQEQDLHQAAIDLHQGGVREVLLTLGRQGSIVAAGGEIYDIPAVPERQTVDATGCGDTYVMAYIYRRSMGDSPYDAAQFASAAATMKLEGNGPLNATEAEVRARML